jgi:hypothetical protein
MKHVTNAERAKRARAALRKYRVDNNAAKRYSDHYEPATSVVDFLADLQHFYNLAQAKNIAHPTFEDALESARGHFEAEQQEAL